MKLGVDARLVGPGLGIARFIHQLVTHLHESVEVTWFGDASSAPERVARVISLDRVPYPVLDTAAGRAIVARSGVDLMHFPANTGWRRRGTPPFVLTVHDLIFWEPRRGRSVRQVVGHRYLRSNVAAAARAADAVVCISESTATVVTDRLGLDRPPAVIHHGSDIDAVGSGGLPGPSSGRSYAVAFAARDPRKRVDLVLRGWCAARHRPDQLKILTGAGVPDGFEELVAPHVASGEVVLVPYLPREELVAVIGGAAMLVHASVAEGFGLPVLEAMAAGVPVISGLTPASREVADDAMVPIDPADPVESIASSIALLTTDPQLRARLVERGTVRAQAFSWRRAAEEYLEVYKQALDRPGAAIGGASRGQ